MSRANLVMMLLSVLLIVPSVLGATLHGTIYDLDLNEVENTIIEVNTDPMQRMVAKDGSYSLTLPPGSYTVVARYEDNYTTLGTKEIVTVSTDGDYVFDLFLFPDFEDEEEILADVDIPVAEEEYFGEQGSSQWIFIVLVVLVVSVFAFLWYVTQHGGTDDDDLDEDIEQVIKIMKKHGGRLTQRELRKEMPLSEAKVSLLVSELEASQHIKKIKKGRGNILVLNK